jgi:hypothetical protein
MKINFHQIFFILLFFSNLLKENIFQIKNYSISDSKTPLLKQK